MSRRLSPYSATPEGAIFEKIGRHARLNVSLVFEMIGGLEGMADWARENKGEFYTKLYPKIIPRETENHQQERSVDDLLLELDGKMVNITPEREHEPAGRTIDAEASTVQARRSVGLEDEQ